MSGGVFGLSIEEGRISYEDSSDRPLTKRERTFFRLCIVPI